MNIIVGCVHDRCDCQEIILLALSQNLPFTHSRLTSEERSKIAPGMIFIYNTRESKISRWTDGKKWQASRVKGSFTRYEENGGTFIKRVFSHKTNSGEINVVIYSDSKQEMIGNCCIKASVNGENENTVKFKYCVVREEYVGYLLFRQHSPGVSVIYNENENLKFKGNPDENVYISNFLSNKYNNSDSVYYNSLYPDKLIDEFSYIMSLPKIKVPSSIEKAFPENIPDNNISIEEEEVNTNYNYSEGNRNLSINNNHTQLIPYYNEYSNIIRNTDKENTGNCLQCKENYTIFNNTEKDKYYYGDFKDLQKNNPDNDIDFL